MSNTLKITLTNEAWKYLYVILSNVYCTKFDPINELDGLFATFENIAIKYDIDYAHLKQKTDMLESTYQTQLSKKANEVEIKTTIDALEKCEADKENIAAIKVEADMSHDQVVLAHSLVTHEISLNRTKDTDRLGVHGRHAIRLVKEILQELQKSI